MNCRPQDLADLFNVYRGEQTLIGAGADRVAEADQPPAWILGAGESVTHSSFAQAPALDSTGVGKAARAAMAQAGVAPADIGLASLYDCYTIMVLLTLEEAGFCPRGQAGAFVESHDLTFAGLRMVSHDPPAGKMIGGGRDPRRTAMR